MKPSNPRRLPARRQALLRPLAAASLAWLLPGTGAAGAAQPPVLRLAAVAELSGSGAAAGSSFWHGVELAVRHINAVGGVLGHQLEASVSDSRSDPVIASGQVHQAVQGGAFAVFGPVYSASVLASMVHTRAGAVPHYVGAEAAAVTRQGHPSLFRTSFTQSIAMPKLVVYLAERTAIRRVALLYVDNDFGRGGFDALRTAMGAGAVKLVTPVATAQGQTEFAAAVAAIAAGGADAVIVYCHEDESAHALRELRRQGWRKPIYGESTLVGQKVIELAGPAAEGVVAHVGLTVDAPIPAIRRFREQYQMAFGAVPDHNGMKGYSGVHVMKIALERAGRVDRAALVQAMKGLRVNATRHPGALMYTEYDRHGDLDRMSFLVEVRGGRQAIVDYLPPLANGSAQKLPRPGAPLTTSQATVTVAAID